jgi:hypothetical protein
MFGAVTISVANGGSMDREGALNIRRAPQGGVSTKGVMENVH